MPMTAVWPIWDRMERLRRGGILEQTCGQYLFLSKLNCAPNCQMLTHAFILRLNKPGALSCIRFQTLNTPRLLFSALPNDICPGLSWSGWHRFRHVFFSFFPQPLSSHVLENCLSRRVLGARTAGVNLAFSGTNWTLPGQLKATWLTTVLQCLNVGCLQGHLGCAF